MKKLYALCAILLYIFASPCLASEIHEAKEYDFLSDLWTKMNDVQKSIYLLGIRDGLQEMGLFTARPHEELSKYAHYSKDTQNCIREEFDKAAINKNTINASVLFVESFYVCTSGISRD